MGPGMIASRGDVSIERIQFDPVKTTWKQTIRLALGWSIGYVCLLIVVYLVIWFGWGWDWAWWILRRFLLLLLIPLPVIFGVAFVRASRHYYAVVQKVPNWPPPQTQVNPLESGIVGARDFPVYEPERPEEHVYTFEGSVKNGEGHSKHHRLRTEYPGEWQAFARLLTADMKLIRCRFSFRAARRFGVPPDEFDNLQKAWERIGFTERTSRKQNAHYKLTDYGFEWMRGFANTPLL